MAQFLVTWRIDIEADSAEGAACKAFAIMVDLDATVPDSATVFDVTSSDGWTDTVDVGNVG